MTTHSFTEMDYGPTDHFGGNSLVNKRGAATAFIATAMADVAEGDSIDETIYDLDDMQVSELDDFLAARGLRRGDGDSDGVQIVSAD